jgi:hypothetical protein
MAPAEPSTVTLWGSGIVEKAIESWCGAHGVSYSPFVDLAGIVDLVGREGRRYLLIDVDRCEAESWRKLLDLAASEQIRLVAIGSLRNRHRLGDFGAGKPPLFLA